MGVKKCIYDSFHYCFFIFLTRLRATVGYSFMSTNRIVTLCLIVTITLVTIYAGSAVFRRINAEMAARDELLKS